MDNAAEVKAAPATAQTGCAGASASGGGLNRRTLYIGLGAAAAAGVFLGWDWLVAVGAASIIVSLAPCLVMCALGLCMSRACKDKKSDVPVNADSADVNANGRRRV